MENASKALLMAASILIGLIILSLGVYLVNTFRSFSQNYNDSMEIQRMSQFNAQFTAFSTRSNVSPHEIVTLTNYAKEFNTINNLSSDDNQYINVFIKINNQTINLTDIEKEVNKISGYKNNPDKFISDLLDGTYVYNLFGKDENRVEKAGQYEYDYEVKENKRYKVYYNCYNCTGYEVNAETGRVEYITFEFTKTYKSQEK